MEVPDEEDLVQIGSLELPVERVQDACEEVMVLWGLRNPPAVKQGGYVTQGSQELLIEACGHNLCILQAPSSLMKAGVTGSVMWDSGVVLAKFLEHAADGRHLAVKGTKCVELGAGCGLVGIVAALLGGHVALTDVWDRLRLLQKNVDLVVTGGAMERGGSAAVRELTWGEEPAADLLTPQPDLVVASDVVFSEAAIPALLTCLRSLCGDHTTVLLAAELRNDVVLETFLSAASINFTIGRVSEADLHPDYRSKRVVVYVLRALAGGHTIG